MNNETLLMKDKMFLTFQDICEYIKNIQGYRAFSQNENNTINIYVEDIRYFMDNIYIKNLIYDNKIILFEVNGETEIKQPYFIKCKYLWLRYNNKHGLIVPKSQFKILIERSKLIFKNQYFETNKFYITQNDILFDTSILIEHNREYFTLNILPVDTKIYLEILKLYAST